MHVRGGLRGPKPMVGMYDHEDTGHGLHGFWVWARIGIGMSLELDSSPHLSCFLHSLVQYACKQYMRNH
jgi:hypothetical protein